MRRVSSARSADSSRVSRSWALASARTRPSKAFRNSAVVTPPCDVCAAIDSTAANRFFSRCCISPTISFWRSVARCRSSARPREPGADRLDLLGPRIGRAVLVGDEEAAERATVGRTDRPRADGAHAMVGVELAPQRIEALVVLDVAAGDRRATEDRGGAGAGVRRPDLDAGNAQREGWRRRHHAMLEGHAAAIEDGDARHAARRERLGQAADLFQNGIQRRVARDHLEHVHLPLEQPGRLQRIRQCTPLVQSTQYRLARARCTEVNRHW